MKTKCLLLILILSCFFAKEGWSQDPEFSQFYAAPYHLNPAMIGFSNQPRLIVNYRHQYPSFENAWLTMGVSYDQHFEDYNSSIGFSVLADRAGGILNTYYGSLMYAYQLNLTEKLKLKAGAQVSYFQQSLDWNKIILSDMIDEISGQTTPGSFVGLQNKNSVRNVDFTFGMLAYTDKFYFGTSFKHITRPKTSFTNSDDPENKLGVRSTLHLGHVIYLGQASIFKQRFYISPNVLVVNQNNNWQVTTGTYMGKGALFGGAWVRHNINNIDALIMMFGVKAGVFRFGYSYDIGLGGLGTSASAHEVSMTFDLGQSYENKKKNRLNSETTCPEIF